MPQTKVNLHQNNYLPWLTIQQLTRFTPKELK